MWPWEGAVREEMFPHSGKPLQWLGDQPGHKGSFRGLEESAAAALWQAEQRPAPTVLAMGKLNNAEEWISDLEDKIMEIAQWKQQKGKQILETEATLKDL